LCAYWPVRNVARDGQQSENETKLLSNVTPCSPSRRFVRSMTFIDSSVWSSVMMTTMFGRFEPAALTWLRAGPIPRKTMSAAAASPAPRKSRVT